METPEDSPERDLDTRAYEAQAEKEVGGRFNHMAQTFEAVGRSMRNLKEDDRRGRVSEITGGQPRTVEIEL